MAVQPFEILLEEVLRQDDIRAGIDRLAAGRVTDREALAQSLRFDMLASGGILSAIVDGREVPTIDAVTSVQDLVRQLMAVPYGDYQRLIRREEEAFAEARRIQRDTDEFHRRMKIAEFDEKYGDHETKRSGWGRFADGVLRRKSPGELRRLEYARQLEEGQQFRQKVADAATLRKRVEIDLVRQLGGLSQFSTRLETLMSRIGPSLRDQVIVPYVLDWLENTGPRMVVDMAEDGEEKETDMAEQHAGESILSVSRRPLAEVAGAARPEDRHGVFLVHGRDDAAAGALRDLLRALGLKVIEWENAVRATGEASPYVGDVVLAGLRLAQAVVILATPDDLVRIRPDLAGKDEAMHEIKESGQARANVIYEAGIADALARRRTVLVEVGRVKSFSDVAGRLVIRLDGTAASRHELAKRLSYTGLEVDQRGDDWLRAGDFTRAIGMARKHLP
ncbi:nucleotide-binding protein [Streptomyces sp. NBC_00028]|uniref:TIR domain-containing protein n=1 Tax=Streptomyces sp. NBC_00028 TaxID=2975624 RepID=UPI003254E933